VRVRGVREDPPSRVRRGAPQAFHFKKETTTLEMFNKTSNMLFKAYLTTSKTQGWFWHRGRDNPTATPAALITPGGAGGAGAATQARPPKMQVLDGDKDGDGLGGGPTGGGLTGTHHVTLAHRRSGCIRRRGRARPCQGGQHITFTDYKLAELDAAKSNFSSALPSAFSKVGIHTLKSCMISY
jgi:hypothetical protein